MKELYEIGVLAKIFSIIQLQNKKHSDSTSDGEDFQSNFDGKYFQSTLMLGDSLAVGIFIHKDFF